MTRHTFSVVVLRETLNPVSLSELSVQFSVTWVGDEAVAVSAEGAAGTVADAVVALA